MTNPHKRFQFVVASLTDQWPVMLHSKRRKYSRSPSPGVGRTSADELSSDRAGSDESSSTQEPPAEPPSDSYVVIDNVQDKASEVGLTGVRSLYSYLVHV